MNRLVPVAALLLAAASLLVALLRSPAARSSPDHVRASETAAPEADNEDRLRALELQVDAVARRVTALERRPVAQDGGAVALAPQELAAEVQAIRDEVRGLIAGEALNSEGGREYLKQTLRTVQEELRAEQRQARTQRMQAAQTDRADRWRRFASEAGLSYAQEQELTRRLQDEQQRIGALLQQSGDGDARPIRRAVRQVRNETDQAMAKTLSTPQLESYEALRREELREGREAASARP